MNVKQFFIEGLPSQFNKLFYFSKVLYLCYDIQLPQISSNSENSEGTGDQASRSNLSPTGSGSTQKSKHRRHLSGKNSATADMESVISKLMEHRAENTKKYNSNRIEKRKHKKKPSFVAEIIEIKDKVSKDIIHWCADRFLS